MKPKLPKRGWFGVPPLGGSNGLGRLKPGLQAVRGSWSQCAASKSWRLPMNLKMLGLIPKTLRVSGSWAQSVVLRPGRLPMNLKIVDLQTNDLRKYGSWSQCARKKGCRLPMNRNVGQASRLPRRRSQAQTCVIPLALRARGAGGTPALRWAARGSWSQCAVARTWRLSMNQVWTSELEWRTAGPRTVPVRSGLSGPKTSGFSRAARSAHVLRTGTVRGPECNCGSWPQLTSNFLEGSLSVIRTGCFGAESEMGLDISGISAHISHRD